MGTITGDRISKSNRNAAIAISPITRGTGIKTVLLLAGAFTFAFLLGEAVHEFGHYLAHIIYGNQGVLIHLDPFGGSRIIGVGGFQSPAEGVVTAAAGPLFNLLLAGAFLWLLRRRRNVWLLPLLMWAPLAMIQEGVNFSIGLLTPGGDAQWITSTGLPAPLLAILGVLLLLAGASLLAFLLLLTAVHPSNSFLQKFSLITIGFCSFMGIRLFPSLLSPGQQLMENLIPFVFSLLLSFAVTLVSCKIKVPIEDGMEKSPSPISWNATLAILSAGIAMFVVQMFIGKF